MEIAAPSDDTSASETPELFPTEWDDMVIDEDLSSTTTEEATQVFAQWQGEPSMEIDPELLPAGDLEQDLSSLDVDWFFAAPCDEVSATVEEQYKETLDKLVESMRRSQETRNSLRMETDKTQKYPRRASLSKVLSSIEKSSRQLNVYLQNLQRNLN